MNPPAPGPLGRLLSALYRVIGTALARILQGALRAGLIEPGERARTAERLGLWQPEAGALEEASGMGLRPIWIHAASVGEVGLARSLIQAVRSACPSTRILLTCNTATGRAVAQGCGADEVHYCPLDTPPTLKRVFNLIEPPLLILVETELWPALLALARARGCRTALVNGRVSARSFPRYRRLRAMFGPALHGLSVVCARDGESAQRLLAMGCAPEAVTVAGDLKYDGLDLNTVREVRALRDGSGVPYLLAASTHRGEEELVFEVVARRRAEGGRLDLVCAPRHPRRVPEVLEAAEKRGLQTLLWSEGRGRARDDRVLIVDTVGELLGFMPNALGVFMGGSFAEVGGHNLLEPAAFGRPIVCGPHLSNVAAVARELAEAGSLSVVADLAAFDHVVAGWLADPDAAARDGQAGRAVLEANRGGLSRTMNALRPYLPGTEG